jgi:uncharacterized protein YcbK (DUF882 family)
MGDLSKNFSRREFACKCGCGFDKIDQRLVNLVQEIRDEFGQPVYIESGCRCPKHNRKVGGVWNSGHTTGEAADIRVGWSRSYYVIRILKRMHDEGKLKDLTYCYRPGVYSVHVGIDKKPRKSIFVL